MTRTVALTAATLAFLAIGPLPAAAQSAAEIPAAGAGQGYSEETYRYLDLFGDVFERVRKDYVEEVSDKELLEAAINGMLTSLDPHSSFLDARHFQDMQVQTRGEFGGLGIEVTMENGWVKVVSPIDDTPAFRAGLKPGDYITHIDDEAVLGLTLSDAVERMRGKVGTDITVRVRRPDVEPFDVTITRDVIQIRSVRWRSEDNVGYIRITSFNEQTTAGVQNAIGDIQKENGDALLGYVLDLRNNPGGLLDEAISIADAFLDHGEIVSTRSRHTEETQRFNAREGDLADGLPLVVLINDGSASASEIVAGALQDHRRALVLGTKSFGKGSVQTIIPLGGPGAVRLTTARYYTPSGRSIQAVGIEPDILVPQAHLEIEAAARRSESEFHNALGNGLDTPPAANDDGPANDGTAPAAQPPVPAEGGAEAGDASGAEDGEAEDYQLTRALDLIRGLALYRARGIN